MRSHYITNMMQPSPYVDFNPLDVLAAAASLQSARIEVDENEASQTQSQSQSESQEDEEKEGDDGTVSDAENVTPENVTPENVTPQTVIDVNDDIKPQDEQKEEKVSSKDDGVFQTPTAKHVTFVETTKGAPKVPNTKPVTVLRVCKPQISDHSYAYMFQLQSLKHDEDEGYSSRSSIDEEGEDVNQINSLVGSPPDRSPTTPTMPRKSVPKVVFISADKATLNVKTLISPEAETVAALSHDSHSLTETENSQCESVTEECVIQEQFEVSEAENNDLTESVIEEQSEVPSVQDDNVTVMESETLNVINDNESETSSHVAMATESTQDAGDAVTKEDRTIEEDNKETNTSQTDLTLHNKYIIEDDESPVSKFAEEKSDSNGLKGSTVVVVGNMESSTPVTAPKQSLLKNANLVAKSNSSGIVHVIPVVSANRVTQILPRPVQYLTAVPGQKTLMKVSSPDANKKGLSKLLMPVATTLTSNKGIILTSPAASPTPIMSPSASESTSRCSTPKSLPDSDSQNSNSSPSINVTVKSDNEDLLEDRPVKTEKTSIGTVGSLSWKSFGGLIQLGGGTRAKEFIRIQGSHIQPLPPSEEESTLDEPSASSSPNPWAGSALDVGSNDDVLSVTNSDDSTLDTLSEQAVNSPLPSSTPRRKKGDKSEIWMQNTELHPLIDHDYCMFTEFNAQIQSSIIATTESKTRIDRRYNKKPKAARTKSMSEPDKPVRGRPSEKLLKGRKGRLKKNGANRTTAYEDESMHSKETEEKAIKRQARLERKILAEQKKAERNKKNFVKITGSYQDEFVYYATRNYRGRPRKAPEPFPDLSGKPPKPIPAGGVNDFDWYRELSKADKTSCFGSSGFQSADSSRHTSPAAVSVPPSEESVIGKQASIPGSTPIHESDVVDLVCELSGYGNDSFHGDVEVSTTEAKPSTTEDTPIDLNAMAEDVCSMLTSMDENELRLLEKLGEDSVDEKPTGTGLNDTSFDGFLGAPEVSQDQPQLCDDLDEISDHDLLPTDISHMNDMSDILTDLRSSASAQTSTVEGLNVQAGTSNFSVASSGSTTTFMTQKLDRAELFPDIHTPSLQSRPDSVVPELTVVSMFWNDLPGLMINAVQHVRLVDIHKQVLPAKDTGILKKRCQMMGLEIANCSELQRDFLIRYANAAKSKSTVIVNKKSAEELIGFYVNPKPRGSRHATEEKVEEKPQAESAVVVEAGNDESQLAEASATPIRNEEENTHAKGGKRGRKRKLTGESERLSESCPVSPAPVTETPSHDVKRSERLRHKKVRYADMANGTAYMEEEDEEATPQEQPKMHILATPILEQDDSGLSSDHENRDITLQKLVYPEETEIRKLRIKARKKRLTKQEKRRLKKLKERVHKKEHKRKLLEKKKLRLLERQKTGGKGKRRLQETHAYTKKVNPEHCYAACPALKDSDQGEKEVKREVKVKIEETHESQEEVVEPKAPLAVMHRDNVHRQGTARVGRWQDGEVYLSMYRSKDSPCIQCMTCRDFYSVRRFLKHMHKQNNPDELLEVNLPQKFELRNPSPTDGEAQDWQEFQTRRRLVELSPNERGRKPQPKPADVASPQLKSDQAVKPDQTEVKEIQEKAEVSANVKPEGKAQVHDSQTDHQESALPVTPKPKTVAERVVDVEIHLKPRQESGRTLKSTGSPDDGSTRHSTRVRKRKQLHPIESYVYSKLLPTNGKPEKREDLPTEIEKVSVPVSPVRATKLKVSLKKEGTSQVVTRLDLKVSPQERRVPAKRARLSE